MAVKSSLQLASTLDGKDPVVGEVPLSWSQDNCLSLGTSKCTLIYDLNPLMDVNCSDIPFKSQAISTSSELQYDEEVKKFLEHQDVLRSVTSRDAALPEFDTYRIYLHRLVGEEIENPGIQAVSFSPCGCSPQDGCVLAVLPSSCRLQLYVKSSDGMSIRWTKALDLFEILFSILSKHGGYLPNRDLPCKKATWCTAWERQYAAYISYAAWSDLSVGDNKAAFLITCTKTNFILMWKFRLPITSSTEAKILGCAKNYEDEIRSLTTLKSCWTSVGTHDVAVGGVHGTITCMSFGEDGQVIRRHKAWKENDELAVSCLEWSFCPGIEGATDLLAAKGLIILHVRMTTHFQALSSSVFKSTHSFPIIRLVPVGPNLWLSASSDGKVTKVWMERTKDSVKQMGRDRLRSEIQMESDAGSGLFRIRTHQIAVSPNLAFLAILKSKPKVSRSVMTENSAYLEIRTWKTGVESLEHLCSNAEFHDHPQIDLLESVRQHLLRKDFLTAETGIPLLQARIRRFITGKAEVSHLKWCLAKVSDRTAQTLLRLEKELVSKQMLKVLRWWVNAEPHHGIRDPPVQNILKWLGENRPLLHQKDQDFIEYTKNCKKYEGSTVELCSVTAEELVMSDDARQAITLTSRISWPRCCLTFNAIQGFGCRKCEVSDSWSSLSEKDERVLLDGPSIYSGLPMV